MRIMKLIPKEFRLSKDSKENNSVFFFLEAIINNTLHEDRSSKCNKSLSEMERLNIESKLIKRK